jgi:tRNA threonylcarbamoyl adenosine modification protein YeaZ
LKILSFDASTAELHLSISDAYDLAASKIVRPDSDQRRYTASEMIPAVDALLKSKDWRKTDLDAVVVGIGPGSFTGVRVAVVVGRTLGQALNLPVLGVSIFDCYAKLIREPIAVVIDAGSSFCYVASYRQAEGTGAEAPAGHSDDQVDGLSLLVPPKCVKSESLVEVLALSNRWLVSPSLFERVGISGVKAEPLPDLNNIAALQSEIAAYRLSLRESPKAASGDATSRRAQLMAEFPYQSVRPLYLRQASVTLKSFAN